MEFTLLAAAAMSVFAFWAMLRWEAKRGNAAGCSVQLWDAGLMAAFVGVAAGRIASMLAAGINPITNPAQIILIRSGISTTVAAIVTIATFMVIARKDLLSAADAIAPAGLAALAGWHAGCLPTYSCLGTESSLPWAIGLDGSAVTRHPVELYAAAALLTAAVGIALWKQHGRPALGAPAGLALMAAGGIRWATEPMRVSLEGGPILVYAGGFAAGAGLVVHAFMSRNRIRR